jgi:predicted Zn-dependent peptidase
MTSEGFIQKPNASDISYMAETMAQNRDKFKNLNTVKQHMPWMDAVTYEDSRQLIRGGNFTKQNIMKILG